MGAQSTRHISRSTAAARIEQMITLFRKKLWTEIQDATSEDSYRHFPLEQTRNKLETIISNYGQTIDNWSDDMLGDVMSMPYIRFSTLDNYMVSESGQDPDQGTW